MRIIAKGVLENGYWGYGRHWPRLTAVEVIVSTEEGERILNDKNIVAIEVPEANQKPKAKAPDAKAIVA